MCSKSISNGELLVKNILDENNIYYKMQYKFKDCKYKRNLLFDFYLPEYNTCIEFDGEQHFKKQSRQTQEGFENGLIRDEIKNQYCLDNKINLIRIPYFELKNKKIKKIILNNLPLKNNEL